MNAASKTGICRIPTINSRIPQTQTRPQQNEIAEEITAKRHLGRRARTGDKEGIVRFIGNVHFAKGSWCGLELTVPVGKNDGSVNGVRYFTCSARCGLMVPLSKISLLDVRCDSSSDNESGPHSMLFLDPKNDRTAVGPGKFVKDKGHKKSTYSVGGGSSDDKNDTYDVFKQEHVNVNIANPDEFVQDLTTKNSTYFVGEGSSGNRNDTFEVFQKNSASVTITKTLESNNRLNKPTTTTSKDIVRDNSKKRTNDTFDLITNDRNATTTNTANGAHNSTDINVNSPLQTHENSSKDLQQDSSVGIKRRRTSSSVEPSELVFSTPAHRDFKTLLFRNLRISSIHTEPTIIDDEESKRDSLELDESLGIFTPFATRTPSLECEINIQDLFPKERKSSEVSSPKDESVFTHQSRTKSMNIDIPLTTEPKHDLLSPNFTSMTDASLGIINEQFLSNGTMCKTINVDAKLSSPNATSMTDLSLNILDDQIISNVTLYTNNTMNMELPLDSVDKSMLARIEQTPSPEELPLDPTPITIESDTKTESSKSKTNSFITSITSITSLDTGYQGDGEMSRPASRGADSSPQTRRPLPRIQARRHEPMTDSDFYTESDADNHEENPLRGDRRAQVIDGTLYGADPQAAADIYANNRENMDSSGVFTDIEGNARTEEDVDISPTDSSSKTISDNSQDNIQDVLDKTVVRKDDSVLKENPKKRNAPSPGVSSPPCFPSPKHASKDENVTKKYKMPKKEVTSKIKTMLEANQVQPDKKSVKKPVGRWDAVMNKITKTEQNVPKKEIKSKVFNNLNVNTGTSPRQNEIKKSGSRSCMAQKSPINKLLGSQGSNIDERATSTVNSKKFLTTDLANKMLSPKTVTPIKKPGSAQSIPSSEKRRIRNRPNSVKSEGNNLGSSIQSSLSDLSAATLPPNKTGSSKQRADVVQVTQVLTANKLSPRTQKHTVADNKKNAIHRSSPSIEPKSRRAIFPPKENKPVGVKECGRATAKGGRTSPSVRPPSQPRVPTVKEPPVAEALAILVQHLVFNVQAFQVPTLKKQLEKYRSEAEEIRLAYQQLKDTLTQEKIQQTRAVEEERLRCRRDVTELINKHRIEIAKLNEEQFQLEQRLTSEKETTKQNLCKQHESQLATLKVEFEKLHRTNEESLDILREENESIREQITESKDLLKDYASKEMYLKGQNRKLREQLDKVENDCQHQLKGLIEENKRLRDENERLLSYGDNKGLSIQEVQSLRAVLELKLNELAELRKTAAEATQKAEILIGAEERARVLNARCEDLQLQLQMKTEYEKSLIQDNMKLQESFKEEINQKRRLSQHNEELQWKLKQNKEVFSKVLEQAEESVLNRSILSSSFNEKHSSSRSTLERTMSFRERAYSNRSNSSLEETIRSRKSKNSSDYDVDDVSPPTSPKVKGVVEKSDSVSYVLEMDESPDIVANRIFRRSFRNATPPKSTPAKGASSKRPRMRTPLSQSAGSSAIVSSNRSEPDSPRSGGSRNGDWEQDIFSWPTTITSSPKYSDRLDVNYASSGSSTNKLDSDDNLNLEEEEEDEDLRLPALPSELKGSRDGVTVLPSPKLLAGEAMVSESNSEDESTSSSQL